MNAVVYEGNLLDSTAQIIVHQVNCQGVMGSGVAKCIREKWPVVYDEYKNYCSRSTPRELLGTMQLVFIDSTKHIANLFGQEQFGYDGKKYTSYDAIDSCLKELYVFCSENCIRSIAFPWLMCCGRGGASWEVIKSMIESTFEGLDITIEYWKL